jgi:hypothetical protein
LAVFSLATHSFGSPIAVPSKGETRLILGLALTLTGPNCYGASPKFVVEGDPKITHSVNEGTGAGQ